MNTDEIIEDVTEIDGAVNPFIYNVTFDYVEHTQITVIAGKEFKRVVNVEEIKYTKLFHVGEGQRRKITELNSGSFRLLMIIAMSMAPNTDRIRIFTNKYMQEMRINSRTSFNTAVNGLIGASILTHYKKNIYWVNTQILFNGDRLKKYPGKGHEVGKKEYYLKSTEY